MSSTLSLTSIGRYWRHCLRHKESASWRESENQPFSAPQRPSDGVTAQAFAEFLFYFAFVPMNEEATHTHCSFFQGITMRKPTSRIDILSSAVLEYRFYLEHLHPIVVLNEV
jgi:hypothetical protein